MLADLLLGSSLSLARLREHADGDCCLLRGSWDPVGVWGGHGGRGYATAIQCLTLQVYTRYPRLRSK